MLTGNGGQLLPAPERGARGGIVAVGLFAGGLCIDVYEGFRSGDLDRATAAQERLKPMASEIVGGLGVPGVKAALDAVGLVGGPVRMPLLALGRDATADSRAVDGTGHGVAGHDRTCQALPRPRRHRRLFQRPAKLRRGVFFVSIRSPA